MVNIYIFYTGCIYELWDFLEIEADNDGDVGRYIKKHLCKFMRFWHGLLVCDKKGSKLNKLLIKKFPVPYDQSPEELVDDYELIRTIKKYLDKIPDDQVINEINAYDSGCEVGFVHVRKYKLENDMHRIKI
jgi:hypothetical protein